MKSLLLTLLTLGPIALSAQCLNHNIPNNLRLDSKTFNINWKWGTSFRVKDTDNNELHVATIRRKRWNTISNLLNGELAGNRFDYLINGQSSFYGEQIIKRTKDAIINRIQVKDCEDNTIGYIVETIENKGYQIASDIAETVIDLIVTVATESDSYVNTGINLSNMYSKFEIQDANGEKVAGSESFKFINEKITLTTEEGGLIELGMNGFNFDLGDDWYVRTNDHDMCVDNRILVLLPVFKSYQNALENISDANRGWWYDLTK